MSFKRKNLSVEKKHAWSVYSNIQLNKQNFRFHKPFNWELIILKNIKLQKLTIVMLSPFYKVKLPLPLHSINLTFDTNTNILKLHSLYVNNYYRTFYSNLKEVLKSFYSPVFLKIKFKGKGYYLYKNKRNTITPQFGYAHRLYLYSYFISVKFLSKTSVLLFGFTNQDLKKISFGLKSMRPINIFTGRGVRFSKQIIYKKVGKVSSYR